MESPFKILSLRFQKNMKILMITENDPAGMGIAFTKAINKFTRHECRLITTDIRYNCNFQKDIYLPDLNDNEFEEVAQLLKRADIIHFHMLSDESIKLGPINVIDYIKDKKIIHHHHGHHAFRANPEIYREKYKRLNRKTLVSTPDLLHLLPESQWIPNLVPINEPLYLPGENDNKGVVRLGQAPTRKDLKNTDEFLNVTSRLKESFPDKGIEIDIIENVSNDECLIRKNRCHIIFDHMQGYYGVSSLESLSQGKPVIAGLDDWNINQIKSFSKTEELPWVIARSCDELNIELKRLIEEVELCNNIGVRSRRFMEKHWNEEKIVKGLVEIYDLL